MAPLAYGFLILMAGAAVLGVVVGAIGGVAVWRLRMNLLLGGLLTVCAYVLYVLVDSGVVWVRAKVAWGGPPMLFAFLVATILARSLGARTRLRPVWTILATLVGTLLLGFLYLRLFALSLTIPPLIGLVVDLLLVLAVVLTRRRYARPVRTSA